MMRKRLSALLICVVVLLSTLLITAVHSTPPEPASGTWTYYNTLKTKTKEADGNTFIYGEEVGTWTGTFEGSSFDVFTVIKHPSGFVTCKGLINFDGFVGGKEGTLDILFAGKKDLETGLWSGKWVILTGTDYLANLRGQGTWWGPSMDLDYAGKIHFEPS
jgi:hypothetical protein